MSPQAKTLMVDGSILAICVYMTIYCVAANYEIAANFWAIASVMGVVNVGLELLI